MMPGAKMMVLWFITVKFEVFDGETVGDGVIIW